MKILTCQSIFKCHLIMKMLSGAQHTYLLLLLLLLLILIKDTFVKVVCWLGQERVDVSSAQLLQLTMYIINQTKYIYDLYNRRGVPGCDAPLPGVP
jgi:hypothetical protein